MNLNDDNISIYFNDTLIATTSSTVSYERETMDQKEYCFTNKISELSATIYSNDLNIIENTNIQVEIN